MMNNEVNKKSCLLALAKFSDDLISLNRMDNLCDCIINGICEIIGCSQTSLMLFDSQTKKLQMMKVRGFKSKHYKAPVIELTNDVAKWIYKGGEILAPAGQEPDKFLIIFDEDESKYFDCELRIPFFTEKKLFGVLNLGKKSTGTEYSAEDITFLRILINIATLAIEKSSTQEKTKSTQYKQEKVTQPKNLRIKRRVEVHDIIGESEAIKRIHRLIEKVGSNDVTVFITGESGTGKELVARAIHQLSFRSNHPLVALNCAALPENLVESELFGHEKGSFTGAHIQKKGKFEIADGSALFLDEIGDMTLATQAKVLRVLQDKTIQRIGGNKSIKVDVRIIVATHKNLLEEIRKGNFREDLYYRINVVQIHLPPLRERKEDILLLAEYFFNKYNRFYDKQLRKIEDNSKTRLLEYNFPGNIRELQNLIERAVIMAQGDQLSLDFLPLSPPHAVQNIIHKKNSTLEDLEKEHIKIILKQVNHNKSQAARLLGIARKTLREKIQKYGI